MADKIVRIRLLPNGYTAMPKGARIVHVYEELEGEPPTLVIIGDSVEDKRHWHISILAPGWAVPPGYDYVATYETKSDGIRLVFAQEKQTWTSLKPGEISPS